MKSAYLLPVLAIGFAAGRIDGPQDEKKVTPAAVPVEKAQQDPMAAMKKWQATMRPSEAHQYLHQFLGKWDTVMKMSMGGPGSKPMESKGTAEYRWLVEGKWLICESDGSMPMMGKVKSFSILGYDNYKHKYVSVQVDSMTTAMLRSEGMAGPGGKDVFLYGPMDEPMTDEHDKPVKYVRRLLSPDEHVVEVHDLAIGETNTKVLEFVYRRLQ
jgi:hypothetical protein